MLRIRAQGREARDRIGEDGEEAKKRAKNPRGVVDAMWETGETWTGIGKNVGKKGWFSSCRPR